MLGQFSRQRVGAPIIHHQPLWQGKNQKTNKQTNKTQTPTILFLFGAIPPPLPRTRLISGSPLKNKSKKLNSRFSVLCHPKMLHLLVSADEKFPSEKNIPLLLGHPLEHEQITHSHGHEEHVRTQTITYNNNNTLSCISDLIKQSILSWNHNTCSIVKSLIQTSLMHTMARILDGWLSSINWLFKSVDYNKREISASCYCAQSLLDVSYCTRWITLISRLL